ncbi:MAG: MBL fold metallo-hydrolase [Anaerolineae bacterium]|nr:MBL fold metallo-hydrolase [Anaerolineae bacterium]NUQ05051.1 MBL fold metallo-hydrolase [Anaerolineae bacterium]
MLESLRWHGAASFAILNNVHIYINPRRIVRPERPADIILISSSRYDFCSASDIDKLRGEQTRLFVSPSAQTSVEGGIMLRAWQSAMTDRACIKAIPIYRADGAASDSGDVGFVISTRQHDIYYTGRTEALPDSASVRPDIIILPIGGAEGGMSSAAASAALRQMRPRWVVPYGWQSVGRAGRAEAQEFASLLDPAQEVVILDPNP